MHGAMPPPGVGFRACKVHVCLKASFQPGVLGFYEVVWGFTAKHCLEVGMTHQSKPLAWPQSALLRL